MNKEIILQELEKTRGILLDMVNDKIDALKVSVENGEPINGDTLSSIEMSYPLSITPALFKGTKPIAVHFGDDVVPVKTWRKAYTLILQRCADIPENRDTLLYLCNKISGRTRFILSDKPDEMGCPIEVMSGVFAEAYFDTEMLIQILTTEILDAVGYDYSGISVSIVEGKRRGGR
jgi:hypothetical protein